MSIRSVALSDLRRGAGPSHSEASQQTACSYDRQSQAPQGSVGTKDRDCRSTRTRSRRFGGRPPFYRIRAGTGWNERALTLMTIDLKHTGYHPEFEIPDRNENKEFPLWLC